MFWEKDYFPNTSYNMKCQFYVLCLLWAFQGPVMNSIPFLFHHPNLECKIEGEWTSCTEDLMCAEKYESRFQEEHHIQSISQEFNFICGGRLTEASILGLAMGGQIIGYVLCMLYDFPKKIKARMMLYTVLAEVVTLFSVNYAQINVITISVILFAWNFFFAFYFGQQYAYICDVYSADINSWAPVVLGCMMPLFGIFYLGFAYVSPDWRNHLVNFTAIPLLILVILWYNMYDYREDQSVDQTKENSKLSRVDGTDLITTLLANLKELLSSERYLINGIIYFICWVGSSCGYNTTFLVFNDIQVGTFFHNLLVSGVFEFASSFIAFFLAVYCRTNNRVKDLMFYTAIVTAVLQLVPPFFQGSQSAKVNYVAVMAPILISKAYNKIIVACLLIDMPACVPFKFLLLLFTISNIASLLLGSMMPFFKVFMDEIGVSPFSAFGIVTLIAALYINKMTYMKDFEKRQSEEEAGDQKLPPQIAMAQAAAKRVSETLHNEHTAPEGQQALLEFDNIQSHNRV